MFGFNISTSSVYSYKIVFGSQELASLCHN